MDEILRQEVVAQYPRTNGKAALFQENTDDHPLLGIHPAANIVRDPSALVVGEQQYYYRREKRIGDRQNVASAAEGQPIKCEDCHSPIPKARLEAMKDPETKRPTCTRCVSCQSQLEKRGAKLVGRYR